jgi:hypothetical protein
MAWQSTLYITNFPESADDAFIRNMFAKVHYLHTGGGASLIRFFTSLGQFSTCDGQVKNSRTVAASVIYNMPCPCVFLFSMTVCLSHVCRQSSSQNALELHGNELEPGLPLNVYISNPERKKERTDHDANEREVYVAGLSKFTTKVDLEKLFNNVRFDLVLMGPLGFDWMPIFSMAV